MEGCVEDWVDEAAVEPRMAEAPMARHDTREARRLRGSVERRSNVSKGNQGFCPVVGSALRADLATRSPIPRQLGQHAVLTLPITGGGSKQ